MVVASEAAVEARSRASPWGCPPALEAGLAGATESSPRALRRPGCILQPPYAAVCAAAQLRAVLVALVTAAATAATATPVPASG